MIATETADGELLLKIDGALYDILEEHLGTRDHGDMVFFLERLSLRHVVRLEALAQCEPDLARDYLRRVVTAGKPALKLV